jgi:hypothetical protein
VKETFGIYRGFAKDREPDAPLIFRADVDNCGQYPCLLDGRIVHVNQRDNWKSPIYMARKQSRISLEILSVTVERLQEISEVDAIAEGIEPYPFEGEMFWHNYVYLDRSEESYRAFRDPRDSYRSLWEKINGPGSWALNPWVWVLEFKRIES